MSSKSNIDGISSRLKWLYILFFALVILPTSNFHIFNGIPFSRIPELFVFLLLVVSVFTKPKESFGRWSTERFSIILLILVTGIAFKLLILVSGPYTGFLACYRTPLTEPVSSTCEKSYEDPFQRFGVTRVDRELSFDQHSWDLSFINSKRFNYYSWNEGTIDRERLPLQIVWEAGSRLSNPETFEVSYVGAVEMEIGDQQYSFSSSYNEPGQGVVTIPGGVLDIRIEYLFDDGYRRGDPVAPGPGPSFTFQPVSRVDGLIPADGFGNMNHFWSLVGLLVDGIVFLFTMVIALNFISNIKKEIWMLILSLALGFLVYEYMPEKGLVTKERALLLVEGMLLLWLLFHNKKERLLMVFMALAALLVFRSLLYYPDLSHVQIRPGGTDALTYESQARTILDTGSMQGGEDIFFGQVFFRYILHFLHMIFGDADAMVAIPVMLGIHFSIFFAIYRWRNQQQEKLWQTLLIVAAGGAMLFLASSWHVVYLIHYGASEYPTWVFTLFAVPLMFSSRKRDWILGSILIGMTLITRVNQALAIGLILAIFAWDRIRGGRIRHVFFSALIVLFICSFIGFHNLIFGGQFIPYPTYWAEPINLILPPWTFFNNIESAEVRALAASQLKQLLVIGMDPARYLGVIFGVRLLQIVWLVSLAMTTIRPKQKKIIVWLLMITPLGYFAGQFFYLIVEDMYPRHHVMPYLLMGMTAIYAVSAVSDKDRAELDVPQ